MYFNKGFAWFPILLIVGLIVVGIAVGGGLYWYQGQNNPTSQTPIYQPSTQTSQTQKITNTKATNNTSPISVPSTTQNSQNEVIDITAPNDVIQTLSLGESKIFVAQGATTTLTLTSIQATAPNAVFTISNDYGSSTKAVVVGNGNLFSVPNPKVRCNHSAVDMIVINITSVDVLFTLEGSPVLCDL